MDKFQQWIRILILKKNQIQKICLNYDKALEIQCLIKLIPKNDRFSLIFYLFFLKNQIIKKNKKQSIKLKKTIRLNICQ
jgi:hypothetical protein